ncbi:MAG: hypothetical protein ACRDD4_11535 [Culicoidibacterales bacterium]
MLRRTTENDNHKFQKELFRKINAFDLQGLTMNARRDKFTMGVEYFDLTYQEYQVVRSGCDIYQLEGMLPIELIKAQSILTMQLNIPLYYILGYEDDFLLLEISFDGLELNIKESWFDTEQLINFWFMHKQTIQTHPYDKNGAKLRAGKTRIDGILESEGLEWGGNIDGFIINDNYVVAIIDCISIGPASQRNTHDLSDPKADPALYFNARGPKYTTWLSTITLAQALNVPHLLFTLDKVDPTQESVGLTGIEYITKNGISYYEGIAPNQNVIYGLDNVYNNIFNLLTQLNVPSVF